jgi:hypothetical protein
MEEFVNGFLPIEAASFDFYGKTLTDNQTKTKKIELYKPIMVLQ